MLSISRRKLISFSRHSNPCLDALITQENGLIRKIWQTLKSTTSQPGQQTNLTDTLTHISRSKDNLAMKTGQSLQYNVRNISLEKSFTKCGRETIPRPFSKKLNLSTSLDQYSKVLYTLFLLFVELRTTESD